MIRLRIDRGISARHPCVRQTVWIDAQDTNATLLHALTTTGVHRHPKAQILVNRKSRRCAFGTSSPHVCRSHECTLSSFVSLLESAGANMCMQDFPSRT
mmetsp:Transcript_58893/g.156799  ORF Transcript_58893/g.156799 Transcript_58893/m.156799 type:complete len:99 (+) Transcript_58893:1332-1628(+)